MSDRGRSDPATRSGISLLLLVLLVAAAGASSARAATALELVDPRSGAGVSVEPGAPALHLVFFAIWCPQCLDELEQLAQLEARWTERGYRLVIVAVNTRQSPERLVRLDDSREVPGRLLYDAKGQAEQRYGTRQLPTHIVLDSKGQEALRTNRAGGELEEVLERLLAPRRPRER